MIRQEAHDNVRKKKTNALFPLKHQIPEEMDFQIVCPKGKEIDFTFYTNAILEKK